MKTARFSLPLLRLFAVAGGGALGGLLRYLITVSSAGAGSTFDALRPWHAFDVRLLAINTGGVLVASWLLLGPLKTRPSDDLWRLFWTTGALGGLTTYSSLMFNLGHLWQAQPATAVLAGLLSLGLGGLAAVAGWWLARRGAR